MEPLFGYLVWIALGMSLLFVAFLWLGMRNFSSKYSTSLSHHDYFKDNTGSFIISLSIFLLSAWYFCYRFDDLFLNAPLNWQACLLIVSAMFIIFGFFLMMTCVWLNLRVTPETIAEYHDSNNEDGEEEDDNDGTGDEYGRPDWFKKDYPDK